MYGIIADGNLIYFKPPFVAEERQTFNPTDEMLREAGWKPVADTLYPDDTTYKYIGRWEEHEDKIVKVWDAVEWTEEEKLERYKTLAVEYIREIYSQDDENKIVREYLADSTEKAEFVAYNAYVEACKKRAYREVYE